MLSDYDEDDDEKMDCSEELSVIKNVSNENNPKNHKNSIITRESLYNEICRLKSVIEMKDNMNESEILDLHYQVRYYENESEARKEIIDNLEKELEKAQIENNGLFLSNMVFYINTYLREHEKTKAESEVVQLPDSNISTDLTHINEIRRTLK